MKERFAGENVCLKQEKRKRRQEVKLLNDEFRAINGKLSEIEVKLECIYRELMAMQEQQISLETMNSEGYKAVEAQIDKSAKGIVDDNAANYNQMISLLKLLLANTLIDDIKME